MERGDKDRLAMYAKILNNCNHCNADIHWILFSYISMASNYKIKL